MKEYIQDQPVRSWNSWFLELKRWLKNHNNEYPTIHTNKQLYQWISGQRTKKQKGILRDEHTKKLESINFIWDYRSWKWYSMYYQLVDYAKQEKFEPHDRDNPELASWYLRQKTDLKRGKLSKERQKLLAKISFIGSYKDLKWHRNFEIYKKYASENDFEPDRKSFPDLVQWIRNQRRRLRLNKLDNEKGKLLRSIKLKSSSQAKWCYYYDELIRFRKKVPDKWPSGRESENKHLNEIKLGRWLEARRADYRNNRLSDYWVSKLNAVGYDFNSQWERTYKKIAQYLKENQDISNLEENMLAWVERHLNALNKGELSKKKEMLIKKLNLEKYIEPQKSRYQFWFEVFESLKQWQQKFGKFPSRDENCKLSSWIYNQKKSFIRKQLSPKQIALLQSINFDFRLQDEKDDDIWKENFDAYVSFLKKYGREPKTNSSKSELKLYLWKCAQRFHHSRASEKHRKPMSKEKIDLLNSIGFEWENKRRKRWVPWDKRFEQFKAYVKRSQNINPPRAIKGEMNPLYDWWNNQRSLYVRGRMPTYRINKFKEIDADILSKSRAVNGSRVTSTWDIRFEQFKTYVKTSPNINPPRSINRKMNPLYDWWHSQKIAFKNGRMPTSRIDMFKEIGIDLNEAATKTKSKRKKSQNPQNE